MRGSIILLLTVLITLTGKGSADAGKLSKARGETRRTVHVSQPPEEKKEKAEPKQEKRAGKLATARREVRKQRSHSNHSRGHNDHHSHGHHDHHSGTHGNAIVIAPFAVHQPYCPAPVTIVQPAMPCFNEPVSPVIVETPAARFATQFPAYPYADGVNGCLVDGDGIGKPWLGRIEFETGSDSDGLDRSSIAFFFEGSSGFGIDFDWSSYTEELPGGGHDEVHLGELNVMFRVAESPYALWRVGLGMNWFGDSVDTDYGVNLSMKADVMPFDPVVLSGEIDLGTVGDAEMLHLSGTVGVMLNRCEIYGGYDYRRIGNAKLQGPMVGLRVWF